VHIFGRRKRIKKPNRPKLWQNEHTSLLSREDTPDHWWFEYPLDLTAQKSMERGIFDAERSFTEIIEEVLEFLDPLERESPAIDN
jgi:hypothetical protein